MSFSFKKFVELVDQDLTEDQLNEIFGVFATADKKQQSIAAKKKAEFEARRDALKKKPGYDAKAGTDGEGDESDPRKVPSIKPKNQQGPWSNHGQGRRAEMDWANQFEAAIMTTTFAKIQAGQSFRVKAAEDEQTFTVLPSGSVQSDVEGVMSAEEAADYFGTEPLILVKR